jgi:hypothetical protein
VEANKRKFYYWLIAISILLFGYGSTLPLHKEILQNSRQTAPASQSFQQSHSLKFTAEAASFEGITVSGRNAAEDKSKSYAKYLFSHPAIDIHAQLASVYIHRFSIQTCFSVFLYLMYGVLII